MIYVYKSTGEAIGYIDKDGFYFLNGVKNGVIKKGIVYNLYGSRLGRLVVINNMTLLVKEKNRTVVDKTPIMFTTKQVVSNRTVKPIKKTRIVLPINLEDVY